MEATTGGLSLDTAVGPREFGKETAAELLGLVVVEINYEKLTGPSCRNQPIPPCLLPLTHSGFKDPSGRLESGKTLVAISITFSL